MNPNRPDEASTPNPEQGPPARQGGRPYTKPALTPLGDIRDLTMGASPGVTDSGGMGDAFGGP